MKTDALIRALALDAGRPVPPLGRSLGAALFAGLAASLLLFSVLLEARPDIASALSSAGFCLKVVVATSLVATAATLLSSLARPLHSSRSMAVLTVAPLLLAAGLAVEFAVEPSHTWQARLIGRNAPHCLALIPLLSAAPAAFLLMAMRRAAPARPGVAGAVIGLAAGGCGAVLYALTCPDDSPLFVAAWYSIAIAIVALICSLAGRRWLRW